MFIPIDTHVIGGFFGDLIDELVREDMKREKEYFQEKKRKEQGKCEKERKMRDEKREEFARLLHNENTTEEDWMRYHGIMFHHYDTNPNSIYDNNYNYKNK